MTVINTLVARSNDIKEAALNLNAKTYETRQTLAGVWDLKPSDTEQAPESAISLDMKNDYGESVVGEDDERILVDDRDFAPGGKYRCKNHPTVEFKSSSLYGSNRETVHSLRISTSWAVCYGYRLAR